ncbi:MAG: PAS domain S-box protein, partial [Pseudomonadota bacterium]
MKDPQPKLTEQLRSIFHVMRDNSNYSDVQLVDRLGRVRLSLSDYTELDAYEKQLLDVVWREQKPQLSNPHRDTNDIFPHLVSIAPVFGVQKNTEPLGAIILRTDVRKIFYPMIQSWPIPSESGESLLIERSGNEVIFLNDLRHDPDSALKLRISLAMTEIPEVMAVQGQSGLVSGKDYRGVEVLAFIEAISDSPWFLITKIDRAEAEADWRTHAPLILAIILMLVITFAAIASVWIWRQTAQSYYQTLFMTELRHREREEEFQLGENRSKEILDNTTNVIFVKDLTGRYLFVNRRYETLFHISNEAIYGKTDFDIFPLEAASAFQNADREALEQNKVIETEEVVPHGDGNHVYVSTKFPLRNKAGGPYGICGIATDITGRKQAEDEVRRLAHRNQSLLDAVADGIIGINHEGVSIFVNPTALRMLGYSEAELLGVNFHDLAHRNAQGERIPGACAVLQAITTGPGLVHGEAYFVGKAGNIFPVEYSLVTIKDHSQGDHGVLAFRDIGKRRETEQNLEREHRFRQKIIESLPGIFYLFDTSGHFLAWNKAFEEVTGRNEAEIDQSQPLDYIDAEDKLLITEAIQRVFVSGRTTVEARLLTKTGNRIPYLFTGVRVDLDGRLAMVGLGLDITDRKKAENATQKSKEAAIQAQFLSDQALELAKAGHWSIDFSEGDEYYILSERTVAIFGDPPRDNWRYHIMNDWYVNIEAADKAAAEATLANYLAALDGSLPRYDMIHPYKRPSDGSIVWIHVLGHVARDAQGNPTNVYGVVMDITESKRVEDAIRKSKEAAEAAAKAKSDFLANMSHEIRTPMNAIIGLTQLVLEMPLTSQQRNYLQKVDHAARALLGILNDILDYSKLEAGRMTLEAVDFKLDDIFHNLAALFSLQAEDKGIELFFDVVPPQCIALNGDSLRLGQVLNNLIGNAVKFTQHGEIHVKAEQIQGDRLRFTVRDTGIGMTEEQMVRLFRSFSQADTSTTRRYGGTGLGLMISKRLIEQMGGEVGVESLFGQGSSFSFTIPFCPAREAGIQWIGTLQSLRTLVVDDQETSLRILEHMLCAWSFDVTLTRSGEEGLDKFVAAQQSGQPFELILIDRNMPGMDGLELARRLRAQEGGVSALVVMMTAFGRERLLGAAAGIDLNAVLEKPVTPSRLFDVTAQLQCGKMASSDPQPESNTAELFEMTQPIHGARLLLVEDNLTNQLVAQGFLERMGLVVEIANQGREAVDKVAHQDYAAVLMDLQMPEMDGFEASRRIRASVRGRDVPIIAMTASAMQEDKQAAEAAGMNDHVAKPINIRALAAALLKWVRPMPVATVTAEGSERSEEPQAMSSFELPGLDLANAVQQMMGDWSLLRTVLLNFRDS